MDRLTLLQEAREAGLRVAVQGDQLVVQGPRRLESIARRILAQKAEVVQALTLEQEVAWRTDAMHSQMTAAGPTPLLLARREVARPPGSCCSCGDALEPDQRYRCRPCVAAAATILMPGQESV